MKSTFLPLFLCCQTLISVAQIPNSNFEAWETIDSIENPVHWQTNNYYVGYTPVVKTEAAIEGNYSIKISSTARDVVGGATLPGCAHVRFLPTEIYKSMTASVRIDSMDAGKIALRVKQRTAGGFFEKIGEWSSNTVTSGTLSIVFPVDQSQIDTLLLEIWAFNTETVLGNIGYSEAILDNLHLTTMVTTEQMPFAGSVDWRISPNPAREAVSVRLDPGITGPGQLRLIDLQGRVRLDLLFQNLSEATIDLGGLETGVFLVELNRRGLVVQRKKLVLNR